MVFLLQNLDFSNEYDKYQYLPLFRIIKNNIFAIKISFMKNVLICASMLGSMLSLAQEKKDSTNSKHIEEVIINTLVKKHDTESSNKMPIRFIENPQVYSSIDKRILENENIFTVDDAYRNVTGLQKMWNSTGRAGDGGSYFVLRGFPSQASTRNGVVTPVTSTIDAINVETLEFLKGPAGTLYGSNVASYGGLINRVTKKPQNNFWCRFWFCRNLQYVQSYGRYKRSDYKRFVLPYKYSVYQ